MSRISPPQTKKNDVGHCKIKNRQTTALLGLAPVFLGDLCSKRHFWASKMCRFPKVTAPRKIWLQRRCAEAWLRAVFGRLDSDQRKLASLPHPGNDAFHGTNSMSNIFQPHGFESLDIRMMPYQLRLDQEMEMTLNFETCFKVLFTSIEH